MSTLPVKKIRITIQDTLAGGDVEIEMTVEDYAAVVAATTAWKHAFPALEQWRRPVRTAWRSPQPGDVWESKFSTARITIQQVFDNGMVGIVGGPAKSIKELQNHYSPVLIVDNVQPTPNTVKLDGAIASHQAAHNDIGVGETWMNKHEPRTLTIVEWRAPGAVTVRVEGMRLHLTVSGLRADWRRVDPQPESTPGDHAHPNQAHLWGEIVNGAQHCTIEGCSVTLASPRPQVGQEYFSKGAEGARIRITETFGDNVRYRYVKPILGARPSTQYYDMTGDELRRDWELSALAATDAPRSQAPEFIAAAGQVWVNKMAPAMSLRIEGFPDSDTVNVTVNGAPRVSIPMRDLRANWEWAGPGTGGVTRAEHIQRSQAPKLGALVPELHRGQRWSRNKKPWQTLTLGNLRGTHWETMLADSRTGRVRVDLAPTEAMILANYTYKDEGK